MFNFFKKKKKKEYTPFRKERISNISLYTQHGVMFEWFDINDSSQNLIFSDHYMKVRRAKDEILRKDIYSAKFSREIVEVKNHHLIGKKILISNTKKEREVYVQSVHKQWYWGYYLVILYYTIMDNGNHSHGVIEFENINCHHPTILDSIEKNKNIKIIS